MWQKQVRTVILLKQVYLTFILLVYFIAGATVYVHGKGTRPVVSNCYIPDSENVGIFVTDSAQVCIYVTFL